MYGVHLVMVLCISQHLAGDHVIRQLLERVSHMSHVLPLQYTNVRTSLQQGLVICRL